MGERVAEPPWQERLGSTYVAESNCPAKAATVGCDEPHSQQLEGGCSRWQRASVPLNAPPSNNHLHHREPAVYGATSAWVSKWSNPGECIEELEPEGEAPSSCSVLLEPSIDKV